MDMITLNNKHLDMLITFLKGQQQQQSKAKHTTPLIEHRYYKCLEGGIVSLVTIYQVDNQDLIPSRDPRIQGLGHQPRSHLAWGLQSSCRCSAIKGRLFL